MWERLRWRRKELTPRQVAQIYFFEWKSSFLPYCCAKRILCRWKALKRLKLGFSFQFSVQFSSHNCFVCEFSENCLRQSCLCRCWDAGNVWHEESSQQSWCHSLPSCLRNVTKPLERREGFNYDAFINQFLCEARSCVAAASNARQRNS